MLVKTQGLILILRVIGEHAGQEVSVVVLFAISLTHCSRMVLNNLLIFVLKQFGSTAHDEAYPTSQTTNQVAFSIY